MRTIEDLTTYKLIKKENIPDLNSVGYLLEHIKTGAKVMLLENDDNNKGFTVGFRTPPFDSTGTPHILEITRRCSGDWYSEPVEHATGIKWAEWIVRTECGMPCDDFPKNAKQKGFCGRHCIMGDRNGTVKGLYIADEAKPHIYDSIEWWEPGYKIDNYMADKIGILFMEYDSEEQMLDITSRITELVRIIYE